MQKTKVVNATGSKIIVKMSINGIITKLWRGEVESGGHYTISIDPNATFREYWCAVLQGNNPQNKVILTSDDCAEFLEVTIRKVDNGNPHYSWKGTKFRNSKFKDQRAQRSTSGFSNVAPSGIPTNAPGSPSNVAPSGIPTNAPGPPSANDSKSKCLIL